MAFIGSSERMMGFSGFFFELSDEFQALRDFWPLGLAEIGVYPAICIQIFDLSVAKIRESSVRLGAAEADPKFKNSRERTPKDAPGKSHHVD